MSTLVVAIDARLAAGESTGDSSYWTGILYGLSRLDADARFLLYSNKARPPGIPDGAQFEWINLPGAGRWWSMAWFPLHARRRRACAIHTQYNLSPLAGRVGVTTIHDVSFFIGPEWFRPRDLFLLRKFVPASAKRAARVITVSETSRSEIAKFIPEVAAKIVVTPNACSLHIDPAVEDDAAARLGVTSPFLLTVGTRWPRKNMRLAIEAAAGTPYPLVVTGKPGWGEAPPPDGVVQSGYVDGKTLSALYRQASLYLAPSFHEGFGLPLLEAFACECPVMCSSGGALPEVAGGAALVMRSWAASDWAQAITELMHDSSKLDDLKHRGLERVRDFSWERSAKLTMDVYRQVAMENRP